MADAEPASPPPPPPPTQSAPGPRAARLQSLLDAAVAHTVGALTYRNFAACFPTPAKHAPGALATLHRDFSTLLTERCQKELGAVLAQRDAVRLLNELDELLAGARRRKELHEASSGSDENSESHLPQQQQQPSALPPDVILQAHLRPFLTAQSQALTARLQDTQQKNVALSENIKSQRAEMEALVHSLESLVADLEGAATVAQQGADGIRAEVEEAATHALDSNG